MPTNRTKRARSIQALDDQHIDQLIVGWPMLAGTGFSRGLDGCNGWDADEWRTFREAMRHGWDRHGRAFMAWWRRETEQFTAICPRDPRDPQITPWALSEFGEPQ